MWRHKWRPVLFSLIVDDFGVEYVGKHHVDHLLNALKENHEVIVNEKVDLYAGINLTWDYIKRTYRLIMENFITNLRAKLDHPNPKKPQHSPPRHIPIIYGAKVKYAAETPTILPLESSRKLRIQKLVGAIRYYTQSVDKKLLVALSELAQQQSSPTYDTNRDMLQLLDYIATYPNDGITYRASNMILVGHVDAAYINVPQSRSHAGSHIMIS